MPSVISLVDDENVSLAESEENIVQLGGRLRKQLWNTRKLSHLPDNAETPTSSCVIRAD